jgi:hypothetical protein
MYELEREGFAFRPSPWVLISLVAALLAFTVIAVVSWVPRSDGASGAGRAAVSGSSEPAGAARAAHVDPSWAMLTQDAIRDAIYRVPAPAGTGLPGVTRIELNPSTRVPVVVHLQLAGINNPAWAALDEASQYAYAAHVLQAIVQTVPRTRPNGSDAPAHVLLDIYGTSQLVAGGSEIGPDDAFARCREIAGGLWHCQDAMLSESIELTPSF